MKNNCFHFIGIGGIGMSALARMLLKKQYVVSGSDFAQTVEIKKLIQEGARVFEDVQFGVKVSVKSEQLRVPMIFFPFLRRTLSYGKSARTMS